MRGWLLWLACLTLALPARAQDASVRCGRPLPSWAERAEIPPPVEGSGVETLLHDVQVRVQREGTVELVRLAYVLHNRAAVESSSELAIDLPAGATLDLHFVRRVRGGASADVLVPADVRVIQPEDRLSGGLYDESRRALLFLEDVRPGDVIDYAYAITTPSTIFDGRVAYRDLLGPFGAERLRFHATWPADRPVDARLHGLPPGFSVEREAGSLRVEASGWPAPDWVLDAPEWHDVAPWVELSEFATWSDVARWALPHYAIPDDEDALAGAPLEELRALSTDAERTAAALAFVQDEIRYLGLEMREHAFVPHPPELVLRRRYGDCKDKALLLSAILGALGIEAAPALVSSARGAVLDRDLPSPFAFDHVVVRAVVDGREVWMDPTRTHERGPLEALPPLGLHRALLVAPGTESLSFVIEPASTAPDIEVEEHYTIASAGSSTLEARVTLRRGDAASMRAAIEREGLPATTEATRSFYAEGGSPPSILAPTMVAELTDGALRLTDRFAIPSFYVDGVHDVSAWAALQVLPEPPATDRPAAPLAILHPYWARHRVRVDESVAWSAPAEVSRVETPWFLVTRRVQVEGTSLVIDTELETRADHVASSDLARYRAEHERALTAIGYEVVAGEAPAPPSLAPVLAGLGVLGGCFGVLVILLGGLIGLVAVLSARSRTT